MIWRYLPQSQGEQGMRAATLLPTLGCDIWHFWSYSLPQAQLRVPHQGGPWLDSTSHEDLLPPPAVSLFISHDALPWLPLGQAPKPLPAQSVRHLLPLFPVSLKQHDASRKLPLIFALCTL